MNVPSMGDSITEGTVVKWEKNVGDWVNTDDVIVVLETDKVSVEVRSPHAGVLEEQLHPVSATIAVGVPLAKIKAGEKPAGGAAAPKAAAAPEAPKAPKAPEAPKAPAAPAAPKAPAAPAAPAAPKAAAPAAPKAAAASPAAAAGAPSARTENRVAMSSMRKRIAQRLKDSQNTAAMLTTFQEVDMSAIFELREKYKEAFEKTHGVKLGFMSAFVCAAAASLKEMPIINAVIDGGDVVYRSYADISVAVASPRGLVVPVLRNTQDMSFAQVELTLAELAKKARADAISLEDMAGGTFTISNGGVFGSMMGTPIINPPQSAILGMHATKMRPVVVNVSRDDHLLIALLSVFVFPVTASSSFRLHLRLFSAGQDRDQAHDVPRPDLRPQADRRQGGRDLPLLHQGQG